MNDQCQVAKVDCDTSKNKPLAAKYDVKGFPTIKWITPDGKAEDYNGARSEAALTAFMDEKCTVDETAGRIPALDQLASKYFAPLATAEKREALLGAAKSLVAAKSEGLAEYYVKIMSKFLEGAEEAQNWIAKESERLGTLAAKKGTVTMKKLEELKMKQNVSFVYVHQVQEFNSLIPTLQQILKAFDYVKSDVVEPVVESAEAVVEKIKEIKEEL